MSESADSTNNIKPETAENQADTTPIMGGVAELASEISDSIPDVSEHAIEQAAIEQEQEQEKYLDEHGAPLVDDEGRPFNKELHVADADGYPKLLKNGKLRKRPKRGNARKSGSRVGKKIDPEEQAANEKRIRARSGGRAAANALIMLGITFGGEEWHPIKNEEHGLDEKTNLENAFGDYFEAKGLEDIPPGIALSIAVVGYAAPRFAAPKTRQRTRTAGTWLKQKWVAWQDRRKARKEDRAIEKKVESDA